MAKVKANGFSDTLPASSLATYDFERRNLNFKQDFRVKTTPATSELVLTNTTSPLDRPEKIRVAYSDVSNIYAGSSVDPSYAAPTKRGVSLLVQDTYTISVTDTTDPDYRIDLPLSFHLVIKVPSSEHIATDDINMGLSRLLGALYDTDDDTSSRLTALLRGSLTPVTL